MIRRKMMKLLAALPLGPFLPKIEGAKTTGDVFHCACCMGPPPFFNVKLEGEDVGYGICHNGAMWTLGFKFTGDKESNRAHLRWLKRSIEQALWGLDLIPTPDGYEGLSDEIVADNKAKVTAAMAVSEDVLKRRNDIWAALESGTLGGGMRRPSKSA